MVEAEIYLDKIRLTECESVEKFLREQDASSARLNEVVAALRRIIKSREEKNDKAADMMINVK